MLDSVTGQVGKASGKIAITLSAAAFIALILACISLGRILNEWEGTRQDVAKMVEGENPVLRKADLIVLSNQYTTLANQVTTMSSQSTQMQVTTQAYVNSLRVIMAEAGIKTPRPPWERQGFPVDSNQNEE